MKRVLVLIYGVECYLIFLVTFLLAIHFVWTMDQKPPAPGPWTKALLVDAVLLAVFALQHSIMARQGFKRVWTRVVPAPIERSTYVLAASYALLLLISYWQPLPGEVWHVDAAPWFLILHLLSAVGWLTVLISTFLIDHFDLFGLKQAWLFSRGKPYTAPAFATPAIYKTVRHPIYLGFITAFWFTPVMSVAHLFFAIMTTAYILVAIQFEERDLISFHGEAYRVYRSGVSMLVPWKAKKMAE